MLGSAREERVRPELGMPAVAASARPLQARRNRFIVNQASPFAAPKRARGKTNRARSFQLLPCRGPDAPLWDAPFDLEEAENKPSRQSSFLSNVKLEDSFRRVELVDAATDKELQKEPEEKGFLPSHGVNMSASRRVATHAFMHDNRQAVVSSDWAHHAHETQKRVWKVRASTARYEFGDVFIGLTEASAFHLNGRCVAFDVRGSFWAGWQPQNLSHKFRVTNLADVEGALFSGTFETECPRNAVFRVTADLCDEPSKRTMTIELFPETGCEGAEPLWKVQYPVPEWESARLLVSFCSVNDAVEIL